MPAGRCEYAAHRPAAKGAHESTAWWGQRDVGERGPEGIVVGVEAITQHVEARRAEEYRYSWWVLVIRAKTMMLSRHRVVLWSYTPPQVMSRSSGASDGP